MKKVLLSFRCSAYGLLVDWMEITLVGEPSLLTIQIFANI